MERLVWQPQHGTVQLQQPRMNMSLHAYVATSRGLPRDELLWRARCTVCEQKGAKDMTTNTGFNGRVDVVSHLILQQTGKPRTKPDRLIKTGPWAASKAVEGMKSGVMR